jgi:hypothetical protein
MMIGCRMATSAMGPMAVEPPAAAGVQSAPQGITESRMLVRRASIEVVVDDVAAAAERAVSVAQSLGGYVQTSREGSDDEMSITIRVPSTSLDGAMDSIASLGRVEGRRVDANDVTEQVVDLDGRVASLRATRDRLRELLSRASGISEVITVERELARVQSDLESLERRLLLLRGSAAMADLTIEAHRPYRLGPVAWLFAETGQLLQKLFVR